MAQKLQQVYLEQTLADVEQKIATADWLQAVDANELNGISVYLQLPELEIDSWATLAGVGPARSEIPEPEKINPASHRLMKLVAEREDGSRTKIELIRSVDWIREQLGESAMDWANQPARQRLHLRIPELRLNDYAVVLAIESCPAILDGPR